MPNRCELKVDPNPNTLTIRIRPERSWWTLIVSSLFLAFIVPKIVALNIGWAGIFLWGLVLWMVWRMIWSTFGAETICVDPSGISIVSKVFGFHRTLKFKSEDVEWIAYHPHAYRSPAGVGLMLRSRVMPLQFGWELEPADAEFLLQAMKTHAGWLADKVKGVTENSFYQFK